VSQTIEHLGKQGRLSGVDVANVADVSKSTVSRWTSGKAEPHPRTQLILSDLKYVVDQLVEFYSPEEVRTWLYARNALLSGQSAMNLIHEGRTEEVLSAIQRLRSLAYI
jgi:transcriptional regulator with XRE-family HTH domain